MKITTQTKSQRQAKIDFLKSYFPNIEKLDFIGSFKLFQEAKKALVDSGHYKGKNKALSTINDQSVMNLIWDAQGRVRYKHSVNKNDSASKPNRRAGA